MKHLKLLLASAFIAASTSITMAQTTPPNPPPAQTVPPRTDTVRTEGRSNNWGWIGLLGLLGLAGLMRRRTEIRTVHTDPVRTDPLRTDPVRTGTSTQPRL